MAIPSEEEFKRLPRKPGDDWLEPCGLLNGSWDGIYGPHYELSLPYVIRALSEVQECRRRYVQRIRVLPVMKWLEENPTTSGRAWSALWKRRGEGQYDIEDHAKRILEQATTDRTADFYQHPGFRFREPGDLERRMAQDNSAAGKVIRLRRVLRRYASWDPLDDARAVAEAFKGYFYGASHLQYCARANDRQSEAKSLLEAMRRLDDPERWRRAGVHAPPIRIALTAREDLEAVVAGKLTPPIKKIDDTAPERALAFELWSHFMRTYRANKATAIYNFLQFEGVKNPPDPRSVERWIKDWRERKVALAPVTKDS